jgi:squalene-hopene/tetraprenyl-beta-curcumene cyclase
MTYTGLKTYIFAGLSKDDPRVKAAVGWARKNYTVERHPGFPYEKDMPAAKRKDNQGLFYYYMCMARALEAWGENPFVTEDGKKHDWKKELGDKLASLQKPDGSWSNEQLRWWEGDPSLCTPYVLKIYSILGKSDGK